VSSKRKSLASLLLAAEADASIVFASAAAADPVWPVAGAEPADRTIQDLEDQGYIVQINWVGGTSNVPLYRCRVTSINNPDRSANSPPPENTTVYVDVQCPNEDHDWNWPGFWFGFGF